jgi:hypothetical protein
LEKWHKKKLAIKRFDSYIPLQNHSSLGTHDLQLQRHEENHSKSITWMEIATRKIKHTTKATYKFGNLGFNIRLPSCIKK